MKFYESNLLLLNQSRFGPGNLCINQLISITQGIYKSFAEVYEVRDVFLDVSKVFVKVLHAGLLFKLKQNGISGNLLSILIDILSNRKQKIVLNGQNYS